MTLSKSSIALLDYAVGVASLSTSDFLVGAVIAINGKPISVAYNDMRKSHPARHPRYQCAEFRALRRAQTSVVGASMFVARIKRDGTRALARPCQRCVSDMLSAGIDSVVYTTSDGPVLCPVNVLVAF